MKKLLTLAVIFALIFMACPKDDETESEPDYGEIGKTGPGGGTIFFAEGNEYMECSGELGASTWSTAVTIAQNYRGGGFSNWHLPTRNELDLMYKNLKKNGLGGFSGGFYWTSAEYNSSYAYGQYYSNGVQDYASKTNSYAVRAIRAYSKNPIVTTSLKIKNESSVEIDKVIWQGVSFAASTTNTSIAAGSIITRTVQPGNGYIYFSRKTNPINARTRDLIVIEKDNQKEFIFTDNTVIIDVDNPDNIGTLAALQPIRTTLKIKNESLVEITDVIWNNISFAENQFENSIKSGSNVTKNVQAGGGYIFFKRKSSPITARTSEVIILDAGKDIEFVFRDNTPIVEVNNTANTGTLGVLQSTVVWFDDAEGEIQPYYLRQHFAGYYGVMSDLSITTTNAAYFYSPKNGKNSIAVGGSSTALLHLKISLTKNAKLSFWYANRGVANFSINNVSKFTSNVNVAWSYIEFELEPGANNLVWKNTSSYSDMYYFLDDILIYYTE